MLVCGFTRAHVSEYSPAFLSGDMNTLSVTFSVSSDLTTNPTSRLSMLIVAIQGLVKTETADSDEFSAISRGNTPIHSAVWKQGSGALYLLVNATLLGKTPYEFSLEVQNSQVAQSAVVPTIAIGNFVNTSEGNIVFTSESLLPAVDMHGAQGVAAPLKVFANFTALRLGQSTASSSARNTLTLTIATKYGFTLDPSVKLTLSGLTGSSTPSGRLHIESEGIRPSHHVADWNQMTGILVYSHLGNHSLAAEEPLILKFNLTNQARPQSSPMVRFWAANIYPTWNLIEKSVDLQAPLLIAGVVSASLTQSSPSQNVSNRLTATLLLQTLLPVQSVLVISGLTGTTTPDDQNMPISVYRYNESNTPQWTLLTDASSPFTTAAIWNQTLGELRVEIQSPTEPLTNYSIAWNVQNPESSQPAPANIRIWGEGPIVMCPLSPDLGVDRENPMLINGLEATLSQSEVSIDSINRLTLTMKTATGLEDTTLVTISGLVGAEPEICTGLAICRFPVAISPSDGRWSQVAEWHRANSNHPNDAHMILSVLEDVPPGVLYVLKFDVMNGGTAQRSPQLFMGCCCASTLTPKLVQSEVGYNAPLLIAGSSAANISQSSGGQGKMNTLTLRLSFNLDLLLTDPATVIVISGLVGSQTASDNSMPATCSGSTFGAEYIQNAQWKATRTRGILTMSLNEVVPADDVLTCRFELLNPLHLQAAPDVRVQLTGAITGFFRKCVQCATSTLMTHANLQLPTCAPG